ncbi:hypothetical protein NDA18_005430 [Ustilago nuda]|nr:hypothetical protein NDA18_005430 [Ustilago nuda]
MTSRAAVTSSQASFVSTPTVTDSLVSTSAAKFNHIASQLPAESPEPQAIGAMPGVFTTTIATHAKHELTQAAHVGPDYNQHQSSHSPSVRTPSPPLPQRSSTPPAPFAIHPHNSRRHKVKVDLRELQQWVFLNRGHLFVLNATFENNKWERTYTTKAMLDGGAAINVMTRPIACNLGLEPSPNSPEVVVQMGNGARVRSEGTVRVAMTVEDAEGRRTSPRDIEFEILPEGPTMPILLGKPWLTRMGVIQFYELNVAFMPDSSSPSFLRQWTKLVSIGSQHPPPCTPDTPHDDIRLLIAAQPYVGTVADLELQEKTSADVSAVESQQAGYSVEVQDIEDQATQWMLPTGEQAQSHKGTWLEQPIEQDRCQGSRA